MFYSNATDNDYFIGSLSSAGYTYPKALGKKYLPHLLDVANSFMKTLDLNSYSIMDESQGTTVSGNMNLPKWVCDAYFSHMKDAIGFVNGYGPTFTFAVNQTRPFLGYDYYLDPGRSVDEAAVRALLIYIFLIVALKGDFVHLSNLNNVRPYFIVADIREFSDIDRVEQIMAALPKDEFELVPLDWLFRAAGSKHTFTTRYQDDPQ